MAQTAAGGNSEAAAFYGALAGDYDAMTDGEARLAGATRFLERLRARIGFASMLDAACGTGAFACAGARLGVTAAGTDLSGEMLGEAATRAAALGVQVDWVEATMQRLPHRFDRRFDLVLCMGNSVPHLLAQRDLDAALRAFRRVLVPGGHVVLHLLNYRRILARRERIVDITRAGDSEFVRFYDFSGRRLRFNLLTVRWAGRQSTHELRSVWLRPYTVAELSAALARTGLAVVDRWGGLDLAPYRPETSETALVLAVNRG